jgi:hypothetical protein
MDHQGDRGTVRVLADVGHAVSGSGRAAAGAERDAATPPVRGQRSKAMSDQPRLIQLADGSWIDPDCIIGIEALSGGWSYGTLHAPRVVVVTKDGSRLVIDYDSYEDAEAERDRLAAVVNGADS